MNQHTQKTKTNIWEKRRPSPPKHRKKTNINTQRHMRTEITQKSKGTTKTTKKETTQKHLGEQCKKNKQTKDNT